SYVKTDHFGEWAFFIRTEQSNSLARFGWVLTWGPEEDSLPPDPPENQLVVFTDLGRLRMLPEDSTLVDLAFSVSYDTGIRLVEGIAMQTGEKLTPTSVLRHGDYVRVVTGPVEAPELEWSSRAKTKHARESIRYWHENRVRRRPARK